MWRKLDGTPVSQFTFAMNRIAEKFAEHKKEAHGDAPVLLICDNLDAHCCDPVLEIFAAAGITVLFVVPQCTDAIQPINADVGD